MDKNNFSEYAPYLKTACQKQGLKVTEEQIDLWLRYLSLLQKWNNAFNLTAITDPEQMVTHHILDSLSVQPWINHNYIIDVGTGAGLPGIPLAIYFSKKHFTLLDSNGKKVRFVQQAAAELGLTHVSAVHSRVENYHTPRGFDVMITRAVGTVKELIDSASHLLHHGGKYLFMKGKYPKKELQGLKNTYQVEPISVPGIHAERHVVIVNSQME